MPNPRYIIGSGEPTVELLDKLSTAKEIFTFNLEWFCRKYGLDPLELSDIRGAFLIGSHAKESGWRNETSDLDIKLVNPSAIPQDLFRYKREVLDPLLHKGEKKRWIDLFFAREDYQVTLPRWDITPYWSSRRLS